MNKTAVCQLALSLLLSVSAAGIAQEPPYESVTSLVEAHDRIGRLGATLGGEIWPGFRPDTIPVLYVLPDRGTLLLGWEGALPEGFGAISDITGSGWQPVAARGAASTGTNLGGRGTAQVVVHSVDIPWVVGTTVHEQFHVFEASQAEAGRTFGRGENSFLVTRYPVFDESNEAAVALEGRLLAAALAAEPDDAARRLAHEFVAVREARQRVLGAELAEFETLAELNEGLAQYAGIRALRLAAEVEETKARAGYLDEADEMLGDLNGLVTEQSRSLRLRFYSSGPAIALLLDRLAPDDWKDRLMAEDLTLQDALALMTGYRERELALRREADERYGGAELDSVARSSIASLRERRRAQIDSVLARPGLEIVIVTREIGGVGFCGIDPQNLLQADDGVLLHTRWFKPCAGSSLQAEFTAPVVQDQVEGALRAVIGPVDEVKITVGGSPVDLAGLDRIDRAEDLEIRAPGLSLRSSLAALEKHGTELRVTLLSH